MNSQIILDEIKEDGINQDWIDFRQAANPQDHYLYHQVMGTLREKMWKRLAEQGTCLPDEADFREG